MTLYEACVQADSLLSVLLSRYKHKLEGVFDDRDWREIHEIITVFRACTARGALKMEREELRDWMRRIIAADDRADNDVGLCAEELEGLAEAARRYLRTIRPEEETRG